MARRQGKKLSEKTDNNFQLKMEPDVLERYMTLLRKVEKRDLLGLASEAEINKRLLGLVPPDKLVTETDINLFRGEQAASGTGRARVGKSEGQNATKKKRVNGEDRD